MHRRGRRRARAVWPAAGSRRIPAKRREDDPNRVFRIRRSSIRGAISAAIGGSGQARYWIDTSYIPRQHGRSGSRPDNPRPDGVQGCRHHNQDQVGVEPRGGRVVKSASARSLFRLRSWNSSRMTAPTPSRNGSARSWRVKTPSVKKRRRVARGEPPLEADLVADFFAQGPALFVGDSRRARPRCHAPRLEHDHNGILGRQEARSENRRRHRVVLPEPGGATSTSDRSASCSISSEDWRRSEAGPSDARYEFRGVA